MFELFGLKEFIDGPDLLKLVLRLVLNLAAAWVVVRGIHYRLYRNRDMAFTYLMLNVITFSVCFLLRKVPIELGFALGLFAVFGVLRYRTEPIRTRDLTFLFVVIGLAILNAVANKKVSFMELLTIDAVIVGLTWWSAASPLGTREVVHRVNYDNIQLLHPERQIELYQDLANRTGLDVLWVDIEEMDLLRDTARLSIGCRPQGE